MSGSNPSGLSSVVSGLVRAQMGAEVPSTVTDEDLDKHIAALILKEAKQKAQRYLETGIRAYVPPAGVNPDVPKTNKRFLSSLIRATDDHNKTIVRQQALAAAEAKEIRDEEERRIRRARAEEAVAARKRIEDRYRDNRERDTRRDRDRDRDRDGERERKRARHSRSIDRSSTRRRSRSRSPTRRARSPDSQGERHSSRRHRRSERRGDSDSHTKKRRRKDSSRSPSYSSEDRPRRRRKRSDSPRRRTRDDRTRSATPSRIEDTEHEPANGTRRSRHKEESDGSREQGSSRDEPRWTRYDKSTQEIDLSSSHTVARSSPSRSPTPGPTPSPAPGPSKMDKYFEESYDPRLDVAPLSVPKVPKTGLISDADFEGWEAMLEVIRARRQDKIDKRAAERWGTNDTVKGKHNSDATAMMNLEYKKRGSTREWDLGKDKK